MALILLSSCFGLSEKGRINSDYKSIKIILDNAVLSDNPEKKFIAALLKVKQFSSVDTAWIGGSSFFVKFKDGGTVSWTKSPKPKKNSF